MFKKLSSIMIIIILLIGQFLCGLKFVNSDFEPSYKREAIYGISFITGLGGIVGYFNIEDE